MRIMYGNDLRGGSKWKKNYVFRYERKPMFVRKKEKKERKKERKKVRKEGRKKERKKERKKRKKGKKERMKDDCCKHLRSLQAPRL